MTNREHAQRLREMSAALGSGSPINFNDAYQAALEAGANALEQAHVPAPPGETPPADTAAK